MASSIRIKNISELPSLVAAGMIHERKSVALLLGIGKQKNSFRQISIWTLLSSYWFYPEKDIP